MNDEGISIDVTNASCRYLQRPDERELSLVQKEIIATLPWDLGAMTVIDAIARLTIGGYIADRRAADMLAATPYAIREELSPEALRSVEVAEAAAHDLADGVMNIGDDALFSAALEDFRRSAAAAPPQLPRKGRS